VEFCVDSKVLGTKSHLMWSPEGCAWLGEVPKNCWHFSGNVKPLNDWCMDSLLRLGQVDIGCNPPERYVRVMQQVAPSLQNPPWVHCMPAEAHRAFVKNLLARLADSLVGLPINYFRDTWVPGNEVMRALKPAFIKSARLEELVRLNVGNVQAIKTFAPTSVAGFAEQVTYDRFGTLTGRLTVSSGPHILTLKREHRDIIAPSTTRGSIMSIDFAALEARILLYEAGHRCDKVDLYGSIAAELGYDRKAVKGAVISELYGSSKQALGEALGISGKELDSFVKRVRNHFNVQDLMKRIKEQFLQTGRINNRYGRPITIDEPLPHIFKNYYAQSTGVDVSLLGFKQVIDHLALVTPDVRPLFLLHDALFLDVPARCVDDVMKVGPVTVPGYVQAFQLKVERLVCTQEQRAIA